jgi:hypothetical protein
MVSKKQHETGSKLLLLNFTRTHRVISQQTELEYEVVRNLVCQDIIIILKTDSLQTGLKSAISVSHDATELL